MAKVKRQSEPVVYIVAGLGAVALALFSLATGGGWFWWVIGALGLGWAGYGAVVAAVAAGIRQANRDDEDSH